MNIVVCIKQVPGTTNAEMDPETGVLKRDNIPAKLNPYDLFALEAAFRIREQAGGRVAAITMGPPAAEAALLEAVYMGADEGVLLTDRRFAGADVMATSYTLSQGIRALGAFDLVLCGKQTTDGDTAQVGPEIAEFLGLPHCANVVELPIVELQGAELPGAELQGAAFASSVIVKTAMETVVQTQRIQLPCLLGMDRDIFTPRLPSYLRKKRMTGALVRTLTLDDLEDQDPERYGLSGSPTQVERIYPPESDAEQHVVGGTAEELSAELLQVLDRFRLV
ncbi:MAG: electron transfer flavoprotein subunit beta/FixA family protein [Clostridiales bacterium]|nr:electron transfer flavoprotein subunit beta/FixA family protein [Clostridiales bacterium]